MSHQSVVEAAVQAAAKAGTQATVIVLGGGGVNGAPPIPEHVSVEHEHYHHSQTDAETATKLLAAQAKVEELTGFLAQRDIALTELQAAVLARGETPPEVKGEEGAAPVQPTEVVSIDTYSIDDLGIGDAANVKKLKKAGYTTIGHLRGGFANLKELKLKGGQKAVIDIAERLMGKSPASSGAASVASTPADDYGSPAGHEDRPWMDRLGATKAKERDMRAAAAKMVQVRAENPDEDAMPDDAYDALAKATAEFDTAKCQVVALVWGLGLDKSHLGGEAMTGSIDDCLRASNLPHLCDEPSPRVSPEPAPAAAPVG